MTRRQLRRSKRLLEDMKADLGWALQNSLDRLVISQSAHPADRIHTLAEQEVDSQTISLLTVRLGSIEAALRAIGDGSFGQCYFCQEEIEPERLEVEPWSSSCAGCEDDIEFLAKAHIRGEGGFVPRG